MNTSPSLIHPRDELMQTMERIYRYRMTTTSGGNLSIRDADGSIWITPARVDIRCISLLGRYYAHKIAGAIQLALFRADKKPATQAQAVAELEKALATWKEYSAMARERYKNPIRFKRVGDVDWEKAITDLEKDIAIAREGRPAPAGRR